jgi:hypothetical protein
MRSLPLCAAALTAVGALASAAPAGAAQTFGSDLTLAADPAAATCAGQLCTWTPSYYRDANANPDGAPIDGVVVRFRARSASSAQVTFRLSVIPRGQIGAAAVGTGPAVTLTGGGAVDTFETRLRARRGTHVGLDTSGGSTAFSPAVAPSGTFGWTPQLVDRAAARGGVGDGPVQGSRELLVNADIEPDADGDGYGDETQDPNPKNPRVPAPSSPPPCGDVDLTGDNGADTIVSGRLQENVRSLGGVDDVATGDEADCIDGGSGNDRLNGNGDGDRVEGGDGNDRIWGGDVFRKNLDPNIAHGDGDDVLLGGAGNDQIIGAAGNDTIHGGTGRDDLFADYDVKGPAPASRDRLYGDSGNDSLTGSRGAERLDGGSGNDDLNGNGATDRYFGGSGNDTIVSADGRKEKVDCGSGSRDEVIADKSDRVAKNCEKVARK